MLKVWPSLRRFQPMWKIRNYFGEKIALYYAWVGLMNYTLLPFAIWGVLAFLYGAVLTAIPGGSNFDQAIGSIFDNGVTPYYALAVCVWSTYVLYCFVLYCIVLYDAYYRIGYSLSCGSASRSHLPHNGVRNGQY